MKEEESEELEECVAGKKPAFSRKKKALSVLAVLLFAGVASAALLTYYATITVNVKVEQSVLLDGGNAVIDEIWEAAPGGEKFCYKHILTNNASVSATVDFETECVPLETDNCDGITTTYLKSSGYSLPIVGEEPVTVGSQPVDITVEDGDCQVTWTIDFPMEAPYDPAVMDGQFAVGLIIAFDGEGEGPAFQIHNNDGTDSSYAWGTWLYSPWGPTINDGWMGWHSGYDNTPLTEFDWISATGDKYYVNNPDGLFTIIIDKCKLGEYGEGDIHWALNLAIGSGFSSQYYTYEQMSYPAGDFDWFDWGNPIVTSTNYEPAGLLESFTGTTIPSREETPFCSCYEFAIDILPDLYSITTNVIPVP